MNSGVMSTIKTVMKENLLKTAALVTVVIVVSLLSLVPPQILKAIIDGCIMPGKTEDLMNYAAAYLGATLLVGAFDFAKGGLLTVFGQRIVRRLRGDMELKLERVGAGYFSKNTPGEISSRFINDVDNVNSLFADGIASMLIDSIKIVGIIVSIWTFSGSLGIFTLCLAPIIYVITRLFQKKMLSAQVDNLTQLGRVNSHIDETLKNIRIIKTFSKEKYMEDIYTRRLEDNFVTTQKVNRYDSCYAPIIQIIRALVITLIVVLASDSVSVLGITVGMAAASIELISNLFSPIETLGTELQNVQKGFSGIKRVNDFFREPEDESLRGDATAAEIFTNENSAELIFEDLSFAYDNGEPVLQNVSLTVKPGSSVTFAGRTGVGKTTLFRLIMGLYKPTSGKITINGWDVRSVPNSEKRKIFGYVEQKFSFIRGTVYEQVTLGDESITRSMAELALREAGLWDCVSAFDKGMDTPAKASMFSQGQTQLLAIARALAADPRVLLLDEVTANLDADTEDKVVTVLQKAAKGRTVLSVSHRLTSMLSADRVILLEKGRVAADGDPDKVMKENQWLRSLMELERSTWQK